MQHRIGDLEQAIRGDFAHGGERAALAFAQRLELFDRSRHERQHVALLRLVAPDLHRRELRFSAGDFTQVNPAAAMTVLDGLR